MAKTTGEARAARLRLMEEKYRLRGYTDQEMAEELQVRRETVHEDRLSIERDGADFDPRRGRGDSDPDDLGFCSRCRSQQKNECG